MNPHLEKLIRQRAIVTEHLRWLDEEVARETAASGAVGPGEGRIDAQKPPSASLEVVSAIDPATPESEPDSKAIHEEVRRGCFVYVAIAAAVLLLVVVGIYLRYR
jgi:hypothetical protein